MKTSTKILIAGGANSIAGLYWPIVSACFALVLVPTYFIVEAIEKNGENKKGGAR